MNIINQKIYEIAVLPDPIESLTFKIIGEYEDYEKLFEYHFESGMDILYWINSQYNIDNWRLEIVDGETLLIGNGLMAKVDSTELTSNTVYLAYSY